MKHEENEEINTPGAIFCVKNEMRKRKKNDDLSHTRIRIRCSQQFQCIHIVCLTFLKFHTRVGRSILPYAHKKWHLTTDAYS